MKSTDRECRAHGGHVPAHHHSPPKHRAKHARGGHANAIHKNVINEFYGAQPDNEVDEELSGGRLHRKRGGKAHHHHMAHGGHLPEAFVKHEHHGHMAEGEAKKPHAGRAHRKRGGRAHHAGGGSATHPMAHSGGTGPKGVHVMPDSEKSP